MLTNRLVSYRTARFSSRGGFTLVELLVVIGIIAILAGVALGPITNGIKKAKQSSGMQSAHSIGLAMYSYANDNNQLYPDKSGGDAHDVASALMAGGYISDGTIFYLSGDSAATKLTQATNTALGITKANVCWDFMGNAGNGVSSTSYPFLPLLWSTINAGTAPANFAVAAGTAITAVPVATNPFGTDGMAIFYINNSAVFVQTSVVGAALKVNMVTATNNLGGAPATYVILSGT